jgi:DNA-nicking Smr family endonuclease
VKRPLKPDELRVWAKVASTVHPLPGRAPPKVEPAASEAPSPALPPKKAAPVPPPPPPGKRSKPPPSDIEPRRKHRLAKERDEIGARIDLHGMTQDRARPALDRFLARAWDEGLRAVLVITGKGVSGDGVLRRRVPEWLAEPALRDKIAGISQAHQRHGGDGALYVALKRKPRAL